MAKDYEQLSNEAKEVIRLYEDMVDADHYIPESGREFYESVMDKAESIKKWADIDALTPRQVTTMENMHRGVQKWIR